MLIFGEKSWSIDPHPVCEINRMGRWLGWSVKSVPRMPLGLGHRHYNRYPHESVSQPFSSFPLQAGTPVRLMVASDERLGRPRWAPVTHAICLLSMCGCVHTAEVVLLRRYTVVSGVLLARCLIQVLSCVLLVSSGKRALLDTWCFLIQGCKWQNGRAVGQPWSATMQKALWCRRQEGLCGGGPEFLNRRGERKNVRISFKSHLWPSFVLIFLDCVWSPRPKSEWLLSVFPLTPKQVFLRPQNRSKTSKIVDVIAACN